MRRKIIFLLTVCVLLFVSVAVYFVWTERSVVTIVNTDDKPLRDVTVFLVDKSFRVGDIAGNASTYVYIHAPRACSLEVEYVDSANKIHKEEAGGYFAPGIRTELEIEVSSKGVTKQTTGSQRLSWLW